MFSATFQEYDAYADAIERVDARFIMQNLERHFWQISGLELPGGITIQHCWSGSGAIAHGEGVGDGVEIAIPELGRFVANGQEVPLTGALLMCKGREFVVSIEGVHRWFNLFLPEAIAHSAWFFRKPERRQREKNHVLLNCSAGKALVSQLLMDFLANTVATPELATNEEALRSFQHDLLAGLDAAYGCGPEQVQQLRGRPPVVDKKSILLAIDAIETSGNPTVPTSILAEAARVSERSLRAGFHKFLGLSPTRYMQLRALQRARQRLSAAGPEETTVARVAADLGMWDVGRFAMRYRRVFGEPPSATLQKY